MPSPKTSKLAGIVTFFEKAHIELAEEGLAMARDAIRARHDLANKVKAGQEKARKDKEKEDAKRAAGRTATAAAKAPAAKATGPKKSHHKKKPVTGAAAHNSAGERRRASQPILEENRIPPDALAEQLPDEESLVDVDLVNA